MSRRSQQTTGESSRATTVRLEAEKRILAAKRIQKIYEVGAAGLPANFKKMYNKARGGGAMGSQSTNPRNRQKLQLHQKNSDLGSLVQINEDSIMSTSLEQPNIVGPRQASQKKQRHELNSRHEYMAQRSGD